jgi:hypothetical protein
MQWLLLMVIASVDGDLSVKVLSRHDTMAQCHVAGTYINWSERQPINNEMLCFPTDREVK